VRWKELFVDAITATDQVTATGFTGTLDGILGSGTPAAATVTTIDASGVATATTFEPDGDTAADDNAAIGYTAAEGLILTGQGSTSDVTIKNDADATVMSIPTGTSNVGIGTTANVASSKLDLRGRLRIGSGTSAGDAELIFSNYASVTNAWNIAVRPDVGGSNNDLKFLRFNSSGAYQGVAMQMLVGGGLTFNGDTAAANALDDYEEGTWTPTITAQSGSITTIANLSGVYTKIGRSVLYSVSFQLTNIGTAGGGLTISNIPFAATANRHAGVAREIAVNGQTGSVYFSGTNQVNLGNYAGASPFATNVYWLVNFFVP